MLCWISHCMQHVTTRLGSWLTFLWLTYFMSTSSLYARLAWVWFWKGRLSFFIATFRSRLWSYAELKGKRLHKSDEKMWWLCNVMIWGRIRALEHTRLFPEHPSQWVLDSDTALTLWMLNHPHRRCRILFLAYFCSWWSRSVSIRTRQTFTNLDHKNKNKIQCCDIFTNVTWFSCRIFFSWHS